jgi:hypothetical protein
MPVHQGLCRVFFIVPALHAYIFYDLIINTFLCQYSESANDAAAPSTELSDGQGSCRLDQGQHLVYSGVEGVLAGFTAYVYPGEFCAQEGATGVNRLEG